MTREQLFERLNETCQELSDAEIERDELRRQIRTLRDACADFRDSVLNSRHQLAESSLDNDQTNAVLGRFDDSIGDALDTSEPKKAGG